MNYQTANIIACWRYGEISTTEALYELTDRWKSDPFAAMEVLFAADPELYAQEVEAEADRRTG